MNMDQAEKHEIIIEVMAEKIAGLQLELKSMADSREYWINECNKLEHELMMLKDPPKGWQVVTPAKRGRPKGSKNKVKTGLKKILKGKVRK